MIPTTNQNESSLRTDAPKSFPTDRWVLGDHPAVRQIARHVERAAEVECPVLITGETGTGKEVWATLVHESGPRADKPFVPVNCAALTPSLAESQLFGHEKGAFTGAGGASLGMFRAAEGGVIFLDEIGEMPIELQPKLLRALQQNEVTPVGASRPVPINVQVVAATNRDLQLEVAEKRFREDLLYRLNMIQFEIPALRDRPQDIPRFIEYFSGRFSEKYDRSPWKPDEDELAEFCEFNWPGNIRQLSHVIEQGYVLDCVPSLPNSRLGKSGGSSLPFFNLDRLRTTAVQQALDATQGHKGKAAKLLGVHANTLTRMVAQLKEEETAQK